MNLYRRSLLMYGRSLLMYAGLFCRLLLTHTLHTPAINLVTGMLGSPKSMLSSPKFMVGSPKFKAFNTESPSKSPMSQTHGVHDINVQGVVVSKTTRVLKRSRRRQMRSTMRLST